MHDQGNSPDLSLKTRNNDCGEGFGRRTDQTLEDLFVRCTLTTGQNSILTTRTLKSPDDSHWYYCCSLTSSVRVTTRSRSFILLKIQPLSGFLLSTEESLDEGGGHGTSPRGFMKG